MANMQQQQNDERVENEQERTSGLAQAYEDIMGEEMPPVQEDWAAAMGTSRTHAASHKQEVAPPANSPAVSTGAIASKQVDSDFLVVISLHGDDVKLVRDGAAHLWQVSVSIITTISALLMHKNMLSMTGLLAKFCRVI